MHNFLLQKLENPLLQFEIIGDIDALIEEIESGKSQEGYEKRLREGLNDLIKWEQLNCPPITPEREENA